MQWIRLRRPSPALVVACLALAVSLAGTSYATASQLIPRNTIGTMQLKNNAVTSEKVRDFSLRLWDFKRGQLPRGPAGPAGPPGTLGDLIIHQSSVTVPGNKAGNGLYASRSIQIRCQSGERAITGGTEWSTDADDAELITVYSRPLIENNVAVGWRARGGSDMATDRVFTVQVLCSKS
jgi:hypothetical protein